MESMSTTDRVVRNNKRLPQSRYSPYILRSELSTIHNSKKTNLTIEKQKEEAIRLGVELSLFMAEAMFILSDDLRSMLLLCPLIVKYAGFKYTNDGPVREGSCGGVVKPSDFEHYNQEMKKLEEMLRDEIKSNILHLWKSLFETPIKLIYPEVRMLEMFKPLLNQSRESICSRLIASLDI
ncbi:hypothetical protein (DUF1184) [Arabidopsis thaliana]|uniref:Uncharacterized protein n=1 Tax=Arabidopsis thaliana TaxID=3702 RepID=F4HYC4_ARATH|nr:hypothetical protein (DUF1184) [Arabidopsis thaliana]AEE31786.1 hypothetical protein (DUF1184) [Arabidopsis thaliana]|eukprot:NP_683351.1 hypothetical protein (DUF1184) [Arabidopsis thaliana]